MYPFFPVNTASFEFHRYNARTRTRTHAHARIHAHALVCVCVRERESRKRNALPAVFTGESRSSAQERIDAERSPTASLALYTQE